MKPRPNLYNGESYRIPSPLGTAFITINRDENGPREVFINIGKSGSGTTSMAEAVGRLISLVLRMEDGLSGRERALEVINQLEGIGSTGVAGFGEYKTFSLPDAVAQAMARNLGIWEEINGRRKIFRDIAGPEEGSDATEGGVDRGGPSPVGRG